MSTPPATVPTPGLPGVGGTSVAPPAAPAAPATPAVPPDCAPAPARPPLPDPPLPPVPAPPVEAPVPPDIPTASKSPNERSAASHAARTRRRGRRCAARGFNILSMRIPANQVARVLLGRQRLSERGPGGRAYSPAGLPRRSRRECCPLRGESATQAGLARLGLPAAGVKGSRPNAQWGCDANASTMLAVSTMLTVMKQSVSGLPRGNWP
jgi:hypothetical protein